MSMSTSGLMSQMEELSSLPYNEKDMDLFYLFIYSNNNNNKVSI